MKRTSISDSKGSSKTASGLLVVLGLAFLLLGGLGTYALTIRPLVKIQQARSWTAVPCEILSSEVERHRGGESDTYSVAITYRYEVDGRTYTADRYHFVGGSSSGRSGKASIVRRYPVGSTATCYVDPADPTQAVIERGYTRDMLFGLIPLVFVLVGAGMLFGAVHLWRGGSSRHKSIAASAADSGAGGLLASIWKPDRDQRAVASGPVRLDSGKSRRGKLIGLSIFAVVWNGIAWFMMAMAWRDGEWFGIVFLSLFVLLGLGVIVGVVYLALSMFNPTVTLTLNRRTIPLGGTLDIEWRLVGQTGRLSAFTLTLEGVEKATYRRGTDTVTDEHVFRIVELAHIADRRRLVTGADRVHATVPIDTMHSFSADRNEIVWRLRARGSIARWPDVNDTWRITVAPAEAASLSRPHA